MSGIVVQPIRFTDNVGAMRDFFTVLGLRARLESGRGGWVDLASGGGRAALHSAATSVTGAVTGETHLSFETDDVDALADRLKSAGIEGVTVYDEAYGRALDCRDPVGDAITVNEQSEDLYGYRRLGDEAEPSPLRVSPVRFTDPQGPYGGFLEALGLTRCGESNESYVTYAAAEGDHGLIGLHYVYANELPLVEKPGAATVQLTFQTTEPLDNVARRLADNGFEAPVTREEFGAFLTVTDPDGQEVQIHEGPHQ